MKKALALLLALVMVLGLFAACGSADAGKTTEATKATEGKTDDATEATEGTKELKTLTFMGNAYNTFSEFQHTDYWKESIVLIKAMEELEELGIAIEFVTFNDEQYGQAAAAKIQAGIDLPDVFARAGELSAKDLYEAGIAANVKDILDEYDEDNSVREFWTKWVGGNITSLMDGDGNIYELPYVFNRSYVSENPEYVITGDSPKMITIRRDWVEAIGEEFHDVMTADELVDLLIKVRENDGNGNGAKDEVLSTELDTFYTGFERAYGMVNGLIAVYEGDEKVTCNLYHEKFPEYIELLKKCYDNGLMDLSVAKADITTALIYSNRGLTMNGYAAPYWTEQNIAGYEATADYQAVFLDEDKDLTTGWYTSRDGKMVAYGGPSVNAEADLEAVATWIDWFYTESSRILMSYGIEGIHWEMGADGEPKSGVEGFTYNMVDGKRVNVSWADAEERGAAYKAQFEKLGYAEGTYGDPRAANNGMQSIVNANCWPHVRCWNESYDNSMQNLKDQEAAGTFGYKGYFQTMDIDAKYMQYAKSQIGSGTFASMTAEENEKWSEVRTTVETYISELIMGLVTGTKDIADLETYIAEVDALGLADMVAIRQAQYERFLAAS